MPKVRKPGRAAALRAGELLPQDAEGSTQDACAPHFSDRLLADATVTFTVTADGFLPDSKQVTVFEQEGDLPFPVVINEIRVDDDGGDGFEYFELYNKADIAVSLDNLSYVVIGDDASGNSGVIGSVVNLPTGVTLNPGGSYLVAKQASMPVDNDTDGDQTVDFTAVPDYQDSGINFENGDNVTHLRVYGLTAANGTILDTNIDGIPDSVPWSFTIDSIGLLKVTPVLRLVRNGHMARFSGVSTWGRMVPTLPPTSIVPRTEAVGPSAPSVVRRLHHAGHAGPRCGDSHRDRQPRQGLRAAQGDPGALSHFPPAADWYPRMSAGRDGHRSSRPSSFCLRQRNHQNSPRCSRITTMVAAIAIHRAGFMPA